MTETPKPGLFRGVIGPSLLAAALLGGFGFFLTTFLRDVPTVMGGLGLGFTAFLVGRLTGHFDRPQGYGLFFRHLLTGVTFGFAGWAFLNGLFREGPGWPWTPWWVLGAGFGFGLYRSHKALLKRAEKRADAKRWLGMFHPDDIQALTVLVVGYALLGICLTLVFRAFSGFIPAAGQALTIGLAIYGLQGARLLLGFAAHERAENDAGFVPWLKANALQIAIVALLLVAYGVFRDDLSRVIPFFTLTEFGLGMAVFGFVLARLRSRIRKQGSLLATASEARDHERVVTELREAEYDEVARPVTRFVESGLGTAEYAGAIRTASLLDEPSLARALAPLENHREPPRPPPLDMAWGFAAGAAMTLGLAAAALALGIVLLDAPLDAALLLSLLFIAFGAYAQQDTARAHFRPWLAVGIAAAGTAILFLDFILFSAHVGSVAAIPGVVWGIAGGIAAAMIGFPALASWRLARRLERHIIPARPTSAALEHTRALQRARKTAATLTMVAIVMLLPLPWLVEWLAERSIIPSGFPPFLDKILATLIWGIAGFGASALARFYGLTRSRPRILAREAERRARRLAIHKTVIQNIERT